MRGLFFLFFSTTMFGQLSSVPYDLNNGGPTFAERQSVELYKGTFRSIRRIDFANLKLQAFGSWFPLIRGTFTRHDRYDNFSISLDNIYFLTGRKGEEDSALALYSHFAVGGSSSSGGIAKVYTVSARRLRAVQEMTWDTRFSAGEPTNSFNPAEGTLVVRTAHYIPGDAHCCVSAMDVITLWWNGTHFMQTAIATQLSEYGRREGKVLPR